jgi:hypothetical protein
LGPTHPFFRSTSQVFILFSRESQMSSFILRARFQDQKLCL